MTGHKSGPYRAGYLTGHQARLTLTVHKIWPVT